MTRMSDFALDILLKQKDRGDKEDRIIREKQMGKKNEKSPNVLCSPCACCVLLSGLPGSAYCMHFVVSSRPGRQPWGTSLRSLARI